MSFYSGTAFFAVLTVLLLVEFIIGGRGWKLCAYHLLVSLALVAAVLWDTPKMLMWFALYFLTELLVVKLYEQVHKKYGRSTWRYRGFLLLALSPLIFCKFCELPELKEMGWFQFVGISYLTFRVLQIVIEIYDGVIEEVKVMDFAAFLLFFPTFSCGPIDRSRRFEADFNRIYEREEFLTLYGEGIKKLMLGLLYKFVLAELCFSAMTLFQGQNFLQLAGYAYSYGVYMFFDFAGYSLMAVGTGYMFGICVPDNFHKPFISKDMKEFWARWHISLSEWFRDFVFSRFMMLSMKKKWFPTRLAGASVGFVVNMLVMGLWHGLSLHYIAYGLYHGLLLAGTEIYQKKSGFYKKNKKKRWYQCLSWFLTLQLVMFGFLIFSGKLF